MQAPENDRTSGDTTSIVDRSEDGWQDWKSVDPTRFSSVLGQMQFRLDGPVARLRMTPEHRHSNLRNTVHGGALLAFIDVTLFAAGRSFGAITAGTAVTLNLATQFISSARVGEPIEGRVELLKETNRLIFFRGLIVQGEGEEALKIASYSSTVQKTTRPSS